MTDADTDLKSITDAGSEKVFGYSFNTRTAFKPPYIVQSLFRQILGYSHNLSFSSDGEEPFDFVRAPSDIETSALSEDIREKIDSSHSSNEAEHVDNLRLFMRRTLRNDRTLYKHDPAPTSTSDWLVGDNKRAERKARFIREVISQADSSEDCDNLEDKICSQLKDHSDGVSLMMRPLLQPLAEAAENDEDRDASRPNSMTREDADPPTWNDVSPEVKTAFGDSVSIDDFNKLIATELVRGFIILSQHLRDENEYGTHNYPRDLSRVTAFGIFALYVYTVNRKHEMQQEKEERPPILLNCTGERDSPLGKKSQECVDLALAEIRDGTRLGIAAQLKEQYPDDISAGDISNRLVPESDSDTAIIAELPGSPDTQDYRELKEMYDSSTQNPLEHLAEVLSTMTHLSSYNTYPARDAFQFLAPKAGLAAPYGGGGNVDRHFQFTDTVLESIILSVLRPGQSMSLKTFCEEVRQRYGIIVGGTDNDYSHLAEWNKQIPGVEGSDNPLDENQAAFRERLINMGYAVDQADTVTIVEVPDGGMVR